jgi:hypothetical protein
MEEVTMRMAGLFVVAACTGTASPVLTSVASPLHRGATAIAVGGAMACALNRDGSMACWGDTTYNDTVALDGSFTQIAMAATYVCGLHGDGSAACSRDDVLPPAGGFTKLSAGPANSTCGLRFDGTVACWFPDWWQKSAPATDVFVDISNGGKFGCGLHSSGTATCWGGANVPAVPLGAFVSIDANSLCAIRSTGRLECWDLDPVFSPPPAASFRAVDNECGIEQDGTLACWGWLVSRHPELARPLPGRFTALGVSQFFDNVHANDFNLCALSDDGAIECIGSEVPAAVP